MEPAPQQDGLDWVLATPRNRDAQLQSIRVGFRGDQLAALDILDSFGQRSVIAFSSMQVNVPLPAGTFEFRPPVGTDVLRQ